MTKRRKGKAIRRAGPFIVGVLIGLVIVSPAFAATVSTIGIPEDWASLLMFGSIIVLVVGLILEGIVRAHASDRSRSPETKLDIRRQRFANASVDPPTLAPRHYSRSDRFWPG